MIDFRYEVFFIPAAPDNEMKMELGLELSMDACGASAQAEDSSAEGATYTSIGRSPM